MWQWCSKNIIDRFVTQYDTWIFGECFQRGVLFIYNPLLTALTEVGNFKIGRRIINKVRFEGDMAIIAKTQEEIQYMLYRMVHTGRKYGMEINIDKSKIMRLSRSN